MSQSHALQTHIAQLKEIRSILNAMKNLAFMEIHKLSRLQAMQNQALANIEQAALDFLSFYPELVATDNGDIHIGIVIGSERGFCGDFNESLINSIKDENFTDVIVIGNRLMNKTIDINHPIVAEIAGANIAEDVPAVINQLIETVNTLIQVNKSSSFARSGIRLTAVNHDQETGSINKHQLFPFELRQNTACRPNHPPLLNLDPGEFFTDLIHHYLFAAFHGIFYSALSAENHNRLQHLEGAVKHLDDDALNLHRKLQIYRQEEITEEIEVILLNSEHVVN